MCFLFCWALPRSSLFCFEAKRKSGWGICGSFLVVVVLLFFVCRLFRDDLPKYLDHTCPGTFLLFTAYAIVRTEPSANRPNRREKKFETWCVLGPSCRAKRSDTQTFSNFSNCFKRVLKL